MSIRPIIGKISSLLPLERVPTNGRTTKIVTSFARRTEGQTELLPAAFTSLSGERLKQNIRIFFNLFLNQIQRETENYLEKTFLKKTFMP